MSATPTPQPHHTGDTHAPASRTWAVGDIHGCDTALAILLEQLHPSPRDRIVLLGDIVDRGPGTRQVIEQLLAIRDECKLVFVQGNHEEMFLDGLAGGPMMGMWLRHGGQRALDSYGGDPAQIPASHIAFLQSALPYWQLDNLLFIHASLKPGCPLTEQPPQFLRWTTVDGREPTFLPEGWVICGHTPQGGGLPNVCRDWVRIDTGACYPNGWLTGLCVNTGEYIQTNQQGEARQGQLPGFPGT